LQQHQPSIDEPLIVRQSPGLITKGDYAIISRRFSWFHTFLFCWLTGDWNQLHCDPAYANKSRFGGMIVHGFFVGSLASTLFGTKFPVEGSGAIYLSQTLNFRGPVRFDQPVVLRADVADITGSKRNNVVVETVWTSNERTVIDGQAVIRAPSG